MIAPFRQPSSVELIQMQADCRTRVTLILINDFQNRMSGATHSEKEIQPMRSVLACPYQNLS